MSNKDLNTVVCKPPEIRRPVNVRYSSDSGITLIVYSILYRYYNNIIIVTATA